MKIFSSETRSLSKHRWVRRLTLAAGVLILSACSLEAPQEESASAPKSAEKKQLTANLEAPQKESASAPKSAEKKQLTAKLAPKTPSLAPETPSKANHKVEQKNEKSGPPKDPVAIAAPEPKESAEEEKSAAKPGSKAAPIHASGDLLGSLKGFEGVGSMPKGFAISGSGVGGGGGMGGGGLGGLGTVGKSSGATSGRGGGRSFGSSKKMRRRQAKRLAARDTRRAVATATAAVRVAPSINTETHPSANSEGYEDHGVNPWVDAAKDHLSTFAIDVDTASFTIARRKIEEGNLPPVSSVRVEEFVNYFRYGYAGPKDERPFAVHLEAAPSPFDSTHRLIRIGVQGKKITAAERKPANLVFLVDVSGSMNNPDKLGLAKRAMHLLVDQLGSMDNVSIVTYAGSTRVILPPTGMKSRHKLHVAIESLTSGGGTSMGTGMQLAYEQAAKGKRPGGISRVIVISDGDANIGRTSQDEILKTIATQVEAGVTMTTIGLGMGNYKDSRMEKLANKGNGNYFYIDSFSQAKRVFREELGGTLQVIAKDVKIQVDWDPKMVKKYRLIGYENRKIADADFRNDKVDAGEIGAGHSVTALYEIEMQEGASGPLGVVHVRHKIPEAKKADDAEENDYPMSVSLLEQKSFAKSSASFRTTVAVAAFAENLRKSKAASSWKLDAIAKIATDAAEKDPDRMELIEMIHRANRLKGAH